MVGAFEPFGQAPDEAAKLRARIEVLEAALRPFAKEFEPMREYGLHDLSYVLLRQIRFGDLRRADAALKGK